MASKEHGKITLQKIELEFSQDLLESSFRLDGPVVVISATALLSLARFLKEDRELEYSVLLDITAVDYFKRNPRFEVVYHFLAPERRARLRVKVPVAASKLQVETLSGLWPGANWFEREIFDMFGIQFDGHPDLRRILMYPEFQGHPLRKDYPIDRRQPRVGPKH